MVGGRPEAAGGIRCITFPCQMDPLRLQHTSATPTLCYSLHCLPSFLHFHSSTLYSAQCVPSLTHCYADFRYYHCFEDQLYIRYQYSWDFEAQVSENIAITVIPQMLFISKLLSFPCGARKNRDPESKLHGKDYLHLLFSTGIQDLHPEN